MTQIKSSLKIVLLIISMIGMLLMSTNLLKAQNTYEIPKQKNLIENPFMPMNIVLIPANIDGLTAFTGDLVLAFDGADCVGAVTVNDVNKVLNLVATSTDEVDKGYRSGNVIRLEYHSNFDGKIYELTPERIHIGSINFEELGTLYADFNANVLGVDENKNLAEIKVYPNPVSQELHIIVNQLDNNSSGEITASLINIEGKVLLTERYPANQSVINIDVSFIQSGEYNLIITTNKQKLSSKIIKK